MEIDDPTGSSKGSLLGWADPRGPWQPVVSLLSSWAPLRVRPNVKDTPNTEEKSLQKVGGTLEWPSTHAATAVGWVFQLCQLIQRPSFMTQQNYMSSKDEKKPWKPELVLWKICERPDSDADHSLPQQQTVGVGGR